MVGRGSIEVRTARFSPELNVAVTSSRLPASTHVSRDYLSLYISLGKILISGGMCVEPAEIEHLLSGEEWHDHGGGEGGKYIMWRVGGG